MLSTLFASVTDTTVPAGDYVAGTPNDGFGSSIADVITTVVDNLGNNAYQTGLALVVGNVTAEGSRFSIQLQTPAQNTFVYEYMSCPG